MLPPWLELSAAGLGIAAVGIGLSVLLRLTAWTRTTLELAEKLHPSTGGKGGIPLVSFEGLNDLPEPVARYLRFALTEGMPLIRSARVIQAGAIRVIDSPFNKWMPFRAIQYFSASTPGFLWDANVRAYPWLQIRVRYGYIEGCAMADVEASSLFSLAHESGTPELAAGALHRYLAEAPWIPTCLLPSANLIWTPIDKYQSMATLTDGPCSVSLEFQFNDTGEVVGVYTPARYRSVNGKYVLTPWSAQHGNYVSLNGMKVPTKGAVQWHLPSETVTVWKGTVTDIEYN